MRGKRQPPADFEFERLPAELKARGRPLSVHPPGAVLQAVDRLGNRLRGLNNPTVGRWISYIGAVVFALIGLVPLGF
jgi:hypothetical protein